MVAQRAAFTVSLIGQKHPELFNKHIHSMYLKLNEPVHDAVIRCILQIFQELEFPEDLEGMIFDNCMSFLISPKYPAAFRVYAMNILVNFCEKYPELKTELKPVILDVLQTSELPSVTSRAKRELKRLEKI
ncbi:MAG TPA: hypothetical protein DCX89_05990 [Saprospirales bacterium]|nr:hypothetical protein [Saprospirales bacterium]